MKNIRILVLSILVLASCSKTKEFQGSIDLHNPTNYRLKNNSGVQVAIVAGHDEFPDSLVLMNGQEHRWMVNAGEEALHWPSNKNNNTKVYFNEDVLVVYGQEYMPERNPDYFSSYSFYYEIKDWCLYTFTPEDYQLALDLQK